MTEKLESETRPDFLAYQIVELDNARQRHLSEISRIAGDRAHLIRELVDELGSRQAAADALGISVSAITKAFR